MNAGRSLSSRGRGTATCRRWSSEPPPAPDLACWAILASTRWARSLSQASCLTWLTPSSVSVLIGTNSTPGPPTPASACCFSSESASGRRISTWAERRAEE